MMSKKKKCCSSAAPFRDISCFRLLLNVETSVTWNSSALNLVVHSSHGLLPPSLLLFSCTVSLVSLIDCEFLNGVLRQALA